MSKPGDISDADWNAAGQVVNLQGYAADPEHIEPVVRAILAAKAEEREACALLAETEAVRVRRRMAETTDAHKMLVNQAWGMCADTAAIIRDAIRKRGEVS